MSASFASWLAARCAEQIELAPGIATPSSFGDARREHLATRRTGGLFDFSFMQCAEIEGRRALECVEALQTRRVSALRPGRIAYTLILREDGSVLNDATVWRLAPDRFWVFTGRRDDHRCIADIAAGFGIDIPPPPNLAVIAIQGAISRRTIERALDGVDAVSLAYYGFIEARFAGTECWIARLGYSGESGYEIVIAEDAAPALWEALLAAGSDDGLAECGFDATDSLRIEAGHILFTRELATPVTPFELGFGRLVDFDGHDFVGARALRQRRWDAPARRLVGLWPSDGAVSETSVPCLDDGTAAMTSACASPLLERRIGIGYAASADASPGSSVELLGGGRARVARLPFYDPPKVLARRGH